VTQALQDVDLVVGRVVRVEQHPGARAPSFRMVLDLGPRGEREASVPASSYAESDLVGRQVVCALEDEEATLLGVHSHSHGLVLLRPDREVEPGSAVA
jgi:tRNA-binding protein